MTTQTQKTDSWLKSRNLPRLAFAVVFSAPVAGAILSLVLGFTVMRSIIFLVPDPNIDSNFVQADFGQIVINTIMVAVGGFMVGGLLGWPVMLGLGLPMHAVLIRKTPAKAWHYAIAGLAAGMIAGLLRYAMERGGAGTNDLIVLLAIGGVAGAIASLMFWLVRRPDKDAAEYKS
jgi:LytS/YehU family sensor histidine kinase